MDELFNWLQANDASLWANYCALSDQWKEKLSYPAYCVAQFVKLAQLREFRETQIGSLTDQLN